MLSGYKMADMFNTVEFVPFILGIIWTIMGAIGLLVSVTYVLYMLVS